MQTGAAAIVTVFTSRNYILQMFIQNECGSMCFGGFILNLTNVLCNPRERFLGPVLHVTAFKQVNDTGVFAERAPTSSSSTKRPSSLLGTSDKVPKSTQLSGSFLLPAETHCSDKGLENSKKKKIKLLSPFSRPRRSKAVLRPTRSRDYSVFTRNKSQENLLLLATSQFCPDVTRNEASDTALNSVGRTCEMRKKKKEKEQQDQKQCCKCERKTHSAMTAVQNGTHVQMYEVQVDVESKSFGEF